MKTFPKTVLFALFLLWMIPGLIGRDPWKADEPYSFGMIHHIMETGDWVVPTVAGEPFLEKPPLYYLSAAATGQLFSPPLEPHDAARLVNIIWIFLVLLFLGLATRETAGREAGWNSPLLLLSCSLVLVPAHKLLTDVSMLAGFAAALYGLAVCRRRPDWGGIWTGTGMGIGFLTKGLFAPGVIVITALALPLLFPDWRTRSYARSLTVAAAASLPWFLIWPLALYRRSAGYFMEWFWYQNFGRFLGFSPHAAHDSHFYTLINLPWLAWPVLPLVLWALWRYRGSWRTRPEVQLPLTLFLVLFLALSASSSVRYLYALPLLLPLAMIAAAGIGSLSQRASSLINRIGAVLFSALGVMLWTGWLARLRGIPFLAGKLPLDTIHYQPLDAWLLAFAILITIAWIAGARWFFRSDTPFSITWASGTALIWGLALTLWLPWLEGAASYRSIFTSLHSSMPARYACVASYGLGESERALLEYYAGVRVVPVELARSAYCDLLIVVRGMDGRDPAGIDQWRATWDHVRPESLPKEHYTLYRRNVRRAGSFPVRPFPPRSVEYD